MCVTDEEALGILKPLASEYGFLVGLSSGAVAAAVEKYAQTMKPDDFGIMIFGDSGRAYLTKGFYD